MSMTTGCLRTQVCRRKQQHNCNMELTSWSQAVVVIILLLCKDASGWEFRVEPRRVTVQPGTTANILCRATVPLSGCRFLLPGDVVVDLSRGAARSTGDYRYYGTSLANGQCGISIPNPPEGFSTVSCQGKAEAGGWKKAVMFLRVTRTPTLPWEVVKPTAVVLPGENVDLLCKSRVPLTECRIGLLSQDKWITFARGTTLESTSTYRYFGTGLEHGQCGVTLMGVTEANGGEVRCVGISGQRWAGDFMIIVVAKTPDPPVVDTLSSDLQEGDMFEASCTVKNGRPAANLTWLLDGQDVSAQAIDTSPNTAWFDHEIQTASQKITLPVTWKDHGKELKCVASHIALFDYVNQDATVISINFAPKNIRQPLSQPALVVGRAGTVVVEMNANPRPLITWFIGNVEVRDDDLQATNGYKAFAATSKGSGRWEARLSIREVTMQDANVQYQLKARNQYGSSNYNVVFARGTPQKPLLTDPAATGPVAMPTSPSNTPAAFTSDKEVCGRPVKRVQLIIGGNQTVEGHWPWIAALYAKHSKRASLEFQCGASLIDKYHVITAAHCVKIDQRTRSKDDLLIVLGKYNLNDWTESHSQAKKIQSVLVHPDYVAGLSGNGSDIAVLRLETPASYTSHIRPICLWDKDPSLESVVGKVGTVVGWGRFGTGDQYVSDVPLMGTSLIASQEECLRSNPDFFFLTTNRTFCAGNRDGGGPCSGDSGSGLVLPYKTASGEEQWYLRGIVSTSLADQNGSFCDLREFVIFTDVAQFYSWLQKIIR